MKVTLLHNPKAGHNSPSDDDLLKILKKAGYKVEYQSTKKKGVRKALETPGELVVVAGGDGTIAKIATLLAGRGVPIAVIPVGTANNIASSLGVEGSAEEVVAGWDTGRRRKFDVGLASGPWGERRFLEAVGFGVFTQSMAFVESKEELGKAADRDGELARDLKFLQMTLSACRSRPWSLTLDGEDLSGEYFLLEIMNTPCIGPNLCMAPEASPGDGRLDLVLLAERERAHFEEYLERRLTGHPDRIELPVRSGRRVEIRWDGSPIHVDDEIYADASLSTAEGSPSDGAVIDIWLESEVEILVGTG